MDKVQIPVAVRQSPLSDGVEKELEKRILSGQWAEGFKLPSEGKLCAEFGVSRTAVREALRELRGQGIIETVNGSGSYVGGGNMDMVEKAMSAYTSMATEEGATQDLIEFRMIIEGAAVSRLARTENHKAVGALHALLQQMRAEQDPMVFGALDMQFHLSILKSCGNAFVSMIGKALFHHHQRYLSGIHKVATAEMRVATLEEHATIIKAIESKDGNQAREALEAHLNVARIRGEVLGVNE